MLTVCGLVTEGGGGKKNKYVRTLKSGKVLLEMMAIVRKGPRVRDNQPFVLNFNTRPIFIGQDPMLPDYSTTRKLIRIQEIPCDKITLRFRLLA